MNTELEAARAEWDGARVRMYAAQRAVSENLVTGRSRVPGTPDKARAAAASAGGHARTLYLDLAASYDAMISATETLGALNRKNGM